ncbi:hypothetical protein ACN47E_005391 [Coniothyrium glycines]
MVAPALRVVVDGDSNKIYRKGEKVTGRITLVVEEEVSIESLNVVFAGSCITKTTRPLHVNGNINNSATRHEYEEKIRLFIREKELTPATKLGPRKYSWNFSFTFPQQTEQKFNRLSHGANYLREPHPLPPTFQLSSNVPGGAAQISYFVQARLVLSGSKDTHRCKQILRYHPTPEIEVSREAKIKTAILYGQSWKPAKCKDESRRSVSKALSRQSGGRSPHIVPCLVHPDLIAPGQHIPLALTLRNKRDPLNEEDGSCTLDSLSVTISTYSTAMCGSTMTQPEDVVSKHVTCIARANMNQSIRFGDSTTLTSNFRLIDDVECVPSFKTYTITRRYALNISIGIKFGDQHFTIRSTTALEILPRRARSLNPPPIDEGDEVEPLPLYEPREPSKEFAPDYESIYALSQTPSSSNSLSLTMSRGSSLYSGGSGPSTAASSPSYEIEQQEFERSMMRT